MQEYEWILKNDVTGHEQDGGVWIEAPGQKRTFLCYTEGELSFDGHYVDVGDNLPAYLAIMDEVADVGYSKIRGE